MCVPYKAHRFNNIKSSYLSVSQPDPPAPERCHLEADVKLAIQNWRSSTRKLNASRKCAKCAERLNQPRASSECTWPFFLHSSATENLCYAFPGNFYVSQYINTISSAYGTYWCFQTFWNFLSESYHLNIKSKIIKNTPLCVAKAGGEELGEQSQWLLCNMSTMHIEFYKQRYQVTAPLKQYYSLHTALALLIFWIISDITQQHTWLESMTQH